MDSKPSPQEAAAAAAKIIGCYPEVIAADRQTFTAGLVETLMIYPLIVVERASNPVHGIPGVVDRWDLTLARIRKHMDAWAAERGHQLRLQQRRDSRIRRRNSARSVSFGIICFCLCFWGV